MRFLTKKQVCEKVAYAKQTLARLVNEKRFPPPVKPSGRNGRALWLEQEVDDWMQARLRERVSK